MIMMMMKGVKSWLKIAQIVYVKVKPLYFIYNVCGQKYDDHDDNEEDEDD